MFTQAWNKYLPVVRILMKRSLNGPQTLPTNRTDFERAAGGRKIKFTFAVVSINKGRLKNIVPPPPVARELVLLLQQDPVTRELMRQHDFEFSMDSQLQLQIRNTTPTAEATADAEEGETREAE